MALYKTPLKRKKIHVSLHFLGKNKIKKSPSSKISPLKNTLVGPGRQLEVKARI
jgi:hypothetical protein